ncbi:MAG TPA: DUF6174 domain-containing protein [Acidimicrobiia bacterium]|nr:DUF6174 domain-containing protein [Acidimicrobiia bacterium]
MSERLERAGRAVVDAPVSLPLETVELERRVSRRRTRRAASIVGAVALVALVAASVVVLNGGDDDATQPIITDGETTVPTSVPTVSGDEIGVLVRDGQVQEGKVVDLDGDIIGAVALPDDLSVGGQIFLRTDADGGYELDPRGFRGTYQDCTYAGDLASDTEFRVCADHISEIEDDGSERQIIGTPPNATGGRWDTALVSPDGSTLLASILGECDSPTTYFVRVDGTDTKAVTGPDLASAPVGWISAESAVIASSGRCGRPAGGPEGAVVVTPSGIPNVIYEFEHPDDAQVFVWTRLDDDGTAALQQARSAWDALDAHDYSFDFQARCFCPVWPTHVTVVDDKVASATLTVEGRAVSTDLGETVPQLLDRILASELNRAAGLVGARYDERGVPVEASIDTIRNAVDDEYAWTISNLVIDT